MPSSAESCDWGFQKSQTKRKRNRQVDDLHHLSAPCLALPTLSWVSWTMYEPQMATGPHLDSLRLASLAPLYRLAMSLSLSSIIILSLERTCWRMLSLFSPTLTVLCYDVAMVPNDWPQQLDVGSCKCSNIWGGPKHFHHRLLLVVNHRCFCSRVNRVVPVQWDILAKEDIPSCN